MVCGRDGQARRVEAPDLSQARARFGRNRNVRIVRASLAGPVRATSPQDSPMIGSRLLALSLACALEVVSSRARAECVETVPSGADRPQLQDSFPSRGLSGYAATLHVVVTHGQGETVLPHGLGLQRDSDSARDLKSAGFELPDAMAGAGPQLSALPVDPKTGRRQTTVDLPVVALPSGPGRHILMLPPLPIAIARASGDLVTLCTRPHTLVVDDPTASTPEARPQPNPAPRP